MHLSRRRKARFLAASVAFSVFVLVGYLVPLRWTGFRGNTFWDWLQLLLVPVVFVAVQQAAFGLYLGSSFAPNHEGMPAVDVDTGIHFSERQVITARNVHAGRIVTFLLGGLNDQIEHLFPQMPMANLRRSQPLVPAFLPRPRPAVPPRDPPACYRATPRHLHRIGNGGGDSSPLPQLSPPAIAGARRPAHW